METPQQLNVMSAWEQGLLRYIYAERDFDYCKVFDQATCLLLEESLETLRVLPKLWARALVVEECSE